MKRNTKKENKIKENKIKENKIKENKIKENKIKENKIKENKIKENKIKEKERLVEASEEQYKEHFQKLMTIIRAENVDDDFRDLQTEAKIQRLFSNIKAQKIELNLNKFSYCARVENNIIKYNLFEYAIYNDLSVQSIKVLFHKGLVIEDNERIKNLITNPQHGMSKEYILNYLSVIEKECKINLVEKDEIQKYLGFKKHLYSNFDSNFDSNMFVQDIDHTICNIGENQTEESSEIIQ